MRCASENEGKNLKIIILNSPQKLCILFFLFLNETREKPVIYLFHHFPRLRELNYAKKAKTSLALGWSRREIEWIMKLVVKLIKSERKFDIITSGKKAQNRKRIMATEGIRDDAALNFFLYSIGRKNIENYKRNFLSAHRVEYLFFLLLFSLSIVVNFPLATVSHTAHWDKAKTSAWIGNENRLRS